MNQNWNNSNYQDARYAELGSAVNPDTNPDWGLLNFFMAQPKQQNQQPQQNWLDYLTQLMSQNASNNRGQ